MLNSNITIKNELLDTNVTVQYKYTECYKCMLSNLSILKNNSKTFAILPHLNLELFVKLNTSEKTVCRKNLSTLENSNFNYTIQKRDMLLYAIDNNMTTKINCSFIPITPPGIDYMLPFYVLLVLLCLSAAFFYAILMMYRHRLFQRFGSRLFMYQIDSLEDLGNPSLSSTNMILDNDSEYFGGGGSEYFTNATRSSVNKRIRGVDTFRGIAIVLMIFVNYGGGQYWFMEHSSWNGLTVADMVFPWFVFVMGVTVALCLFKFSLKKVKKLYWFNFWFRALRRSCILFIIGVGLENPQSKLDTLRIMGPLQRLAIAYFCLISVKCLLSAMKEFCKLQSNAEIECELLQSCNDVNQPWYCNIQNVLQDIFKCYPYIIIAAGLLISHACISLLVFVDNCPLKYLGPGGIGDNGCCSNCSGGVAGYIDRLILKPNHMYQYPTSHKLYNTTQPFDPEGILGNLTSIALCFLGYWAGNVMLLNKEWLSIIKRLFLYSAICAGIGVGLCQGTLNDGLIPINKNLWSVSFVLITGATGFFMLSVLFVLVDVFKIWSGSPFRYPGMNAIVIYVGHILLETTFPVQWNLTPQSSHTYYIMMNVWGTVFWTGIGFLMYFKKLFISI